MTIQNKPPDLENIEEQVRNLSFDLKLKLLEFIFDDLKQSVNLGVQRKVEQELDVDYSDISEEEWLKGAANNPAFAWLNDPAEDIYTIEDGKPVEYEE